MGVPTPVWKTAGYDHPNTVAGLMARREQLIRLRLKLTDDIRRITCDIDHLEGAIAVFNPENTPESAERYILRYRGRGGHVRRYVLDRFREAARPLGTDELVEGWMVERAIPVHHVTMVIMRRRLSATIHHLIAKGALRSIRTGKKNALYELVRD